MCPGEGEALEAGGRRGWSCPPHPDSERGEPWQSQAEPRAPPSTQHPSCLQPCQLLTGFRNLQ